MKRVCFQSVSSTYTGWWLALACSVFVACGCAAVNGGNKKSAAGQALKKSVLPKTWVWKKSAIDTEEAYEDGLQAYRGGDLPNAQAYVSLRAELLAHAAKKLKKELDSGDGQEGFERFTQMLSLFYVPDGKSLDTPLIPRRTVTASARALLIEAAKNVLAVFAERGEVIKVIVARGGLHYFGHRPVVQRKHIRQIIDWYVQVDEAAADDKDKDKDKELISTDILDVLQKASRHWPAPVVLEAHRNQVSRLLKQLKRAATAHATEEEKSSKNGGARFLEAQAVRQTSRQLALQMYESYVLGGQWKQALRQAAIWPFSADRDVLLRRLLKNVLGKHATAADFQALADYFSGEAPHVKELICRKAAAQFKKAAQPYVCLGELAGRKDQSLRAMTSFEKAVHRNPKWYRAWTALARAYLFRLHALVVRQNTADVMGMLERNKKLHHAATLRWPTRPLEVSLARAFFAAGRAYANEGKMDVAARFYRKALAVEKISEAHMELGHILFWRGRYVKAAAQYEAAVEASGGGGRKIYWLGKVAVKQARCLKERKRENEARRMLIRAMSGLMRLVRLINDSDMRSQILVHQADILDELGKRDHAVRLLRAAVDLAPERTATYADALSFTVSRGLVEEALDLHSRALVREKITEYQKAYASLWVLDLGRRCGVEKLRLHAAREFLKGLSGDQWYHRLAAWELGRVSTAELRKEVQNLGQRVELDFYEAMRRLRAGDRRGAVKLWKRVVASGLHVYYEFRMAARYLKKVPPCQKEEI
jgi:tetratricopeptide (TPR) repeat protein